MEGGLIEPHYPEGEGGRPACPLTAICAYVPKMDIGLPKSVCRSGLQIEKTKAQARAKVEHPFRVIKRQFGYTKVRFRGLVKNTAQLVTLFALSNLWMARRHLLTNAGEVRL